VRTSGDWPMLPARMTMFCMWSSCIWLKGPSLRQDPNEACRLRLARWHLGHRKPPRGRGGAGRERHATNTARPWAGLRARGRTGLGDCPSKGGAWAGITGSGRAEPLKRANGSVRPREKENPERGRGHVNNCVPKLSDRSVDEGQRDDWGGLPGQTERELPCEWLQSRDATSDQKSMMEMVWAKTCCEVRCHNRVAEKGRLGSQESEPSPSIRSPAMRFE